MSDNEKVVSDVPPRYLFLGSIVLMHAALEVIIIVQQFDQTKERRGFDHNS